MEKKENMGALISNKVDWSKGNVKVANKGLDIKTNYLTDEQNNMLRLIFAKMSAKSFDWQYRTIKLSKSEIFKTLKLSKNDIQRDWWSYEKQILKFNSEVLTKLSIFNETEEEFQVLNLFSGIKVKKGVRTAKGQDDIALIYVSETARDFFYHLGKEKPFFTYNLGQYISLKGSASKALFENLRRFYYIGKTKSQRYSDKYYEIEELKQMLGMDDYSNQNFTRQLKEVIVPRLRNTVSFESLTMEVIKAYNKTIGYTFKWSYKEEEERLDKMTKLNNLIDTGTFTKEAVRNYRSGYAEGAKDAEYIEEYFDYVDTVAYRLEQRKKVEAYAKGVYAKAEKKKRTAQNIAEQNAK